MTPPPARRRRDLSSATEDTPYIVSAEALLEGFSDPDGDTLSVADLTADNGATVTDNGDGTYTITMPADFFGAVTLNYNVTDGTSTREASQVFGVDAVADAPTASSAVIALATRTAYTFSAADFGFADADGDSFKSLTITALPENGTLTFDGVAVTVDQVIPAEDITKLVWTPDAGATSNSEPSLGFKVTDSTDMTSEEVNTITFDINNAPTGSPSATLAAGSEDTAYTVSAADLLAGFSDEDGDSLSVTGLSVSDGATVIDNGDGTFTVKPKANFNGTLTLSYGVTDGQDTVAASQTIEFTAVNDSPTGSATTDLPAGIEDIAYTVSAADLLAGFSDLDDDTLSVTGLAADGGATVTDNGDGTFTITPTADFVGTVTLAYTVSDGHGGTTAAAQSVTFEAANEDNTAPTATNGTVTLLEDGSHAFVAADFGFADADGDALGSITITALPANGSLTLDGVAVLTRQSISAANLGKLVFTPDADSNGDGLASLSFTVTDSRGATSAKANTITFDVEAVNDAPAGAASATLAKGLEGASYTVSASDLLAGFPMSTAIRFSVSDLAADNGATVTDNGNGTFTITPAEGFSGTVALTYTVSDGHGGTAAAGQTVTFEALREDNTAPTAANATVTLSEDGAYTFKIADFGFADADGDALAAVTITALPANGSLTLSDQPVTANQVITAAQIANLVWTPDADANGESLASIGFTVTDSQGAVSQSANTISFDVEAVNDAPVAIKDHVSIKEGKTATVDVLANDRDIDGDTLSIVDAAVTSGHGRVKIDKDGHLVVAYDGKGLDKGESAKITVNYETTDGEYSDSGVLTVTVKGVYDPGDHIVGTGKSDHLKGTNQGEEIFGKAGKDVIKGQGGSDTIYGGGGNDTLIGGKGDDTFVFLKKDGHDTIKDFDASGKHHDVIDLSDAGDFTFRDIKQAAHAHGHDLTLELSGKLQISLDNIDLQDLSRDHFLL